MNENPAARETDTLQTLAYWMLVSVPGTCSHNEIAHSRHYIPCLSHCHVPYCGDTAEPFGGFPGVILLLSPFLVFWNLLLGNVLMCFTIGQAS